MNVRALVLTLATFSIAAASVVFFTEPIASAGSALPTSSNVKTLLNTTPRHREWVVVPVGSTSVLAWVVYPERADKAPVVVTEKQPLATDWIRAVSDQVAASGFIAVVPDVLAEVDRNGENRSHFASLSGTEALSRLGTAEIDRRISAVRTFALALPAASGKVAGLRFDTRAGLIEAAVSQPAIAAATFSLNNRAWAQAISFLSAKTNDHPLFVPNPEDHSAHFAALSTQASRGDGVRGGGQRGGGLANKSPDLPAGYFTAKSTLAKSTLRKEWVDIPMDGVKLHTWIEYPPGTEKTGVVIVMQHGVGLDDWQRALADQIALQGFIAVAPDLWSGTGPNGGNWDASPFIDDAIRAATGKITPDETMRRYKAAREFALRLPRANGKSGSIGFCAGGGNSFRFAGEVPDLNAAVVYYGTSPDEPTMAKIKAPVLGFYGENDARVTSTVQPTIESMKRLGKTYEPHIYVKGTHSFALFQDIGGNPAAIADAWPRTIAFFKEQLK